MILEEDLKVLILCSYFNRPLLVRKMLNSILLANEHYQNWELLFVDDGSKIPGRPIVEEILKEHIGKVSFRQSGMNFEDKINHGIILGKIANEGIQKSDADIALILCDDDELVPSYLKEISEFFLCNEEILYCYSKIHLYNPFLQETKEVDNISGKFNSWNEPINPVNKVDATQVAWRLDCCKKHGAWFEESTKFIKGKPWTRDTDKSLFENLYEKCGLCYPTGIIGQYKGVHDYQLLWHKNVDENQLFSYHKMCEELGGVKF